MSVWCSHVIESPTRATRSGFAGSVVVVDATVVGGAVVAGRVGSVVVVGRLVVDRVGAAASAGGGCRVSAVGCDVEVDIVVDVERVVAVGTASTNAIDAGNSTN